MRIKDFLTILCSFLCISCSATYGKYGGINLFVDQTRVYDEKNNTVTVSQNIQIKPLRTVASTLSAIILQNPWAAVAGAVPEVADTAGDITKSAFGTGEFSEAKAEVHTAKTQVIGTPQQIPINRTP